MLDADLYDTVVLALSTGTRRMEALSIRWRDVSPVDLKSPDEPRKPITLRQSWPKALEAAGIEDFRFHDLRHSIASYLAMNGASLAEIAEVLGHKTLAMVKRYAHISPQHIRGVVERMNAAIFDDAAGKG